MFTITHDPFRPHKRTARMLADAKSRGFLTMVCLDDRTSEEDRERIAPLADHLISWTSEGFCEKAYRYVGEVPTPFVLFVSDDEYPSEMLWSVAANPPAIARWGIPVIPVLGTRYDRKHMGLQERLSATKGWQWIGGFEGHSEGARQAILQPNPGAIIWHYLLEAPREDREEKVRRYDLLSGESGRVHTSAAQRVLYEEREAEIIPLPEQLRRFLPNLTN